MRPHGVVGAALFAAILVTGCSAGSAVSTEETAGASATSNSVMQDVEDNWILMTETRHNELCQASEGGTTVTPDVVMSYALGDTSRWGDADEVAAAVALVLKVQCPSVKPLGDASSVDAQFVAQKEWERTIAEIGSQEEVCEAWLANGFDESIMQSAAYPSLERAGVQPDSESIAQFVVAYKSMIHGNCS